MINKINVEIIKYYFIRFRFISFLIIWIILMYFSFNKVFFRIWALLFWPLIMFPIYIINIIQNLDKLNLFNSNYFWSYHPESNIIWTIFFIVFGGLYSSAILTLLSGSNDKIKKRIWTFLFLFLLISLIFKAHYYYLRYKEDPNIDITIGSDNLLPVLSEIIVIVSCIYCLSHINKKVNLELIKKTFKKYVFIIFEFLLVLFVALIFRRFLLSSDANIIDRIATPLSIFVFGFFFFLILELIHNYSNDRQ